MSEGPFDPLKKRVKKKQWVLIGQTLVPYPEVMWMDPEQLVDLLLVPHVFFGEKYEKEVSRCDFYK